MSIINIIQNYYSLIRSVDADANEIRHAQFCLTRSPKVKHNFEHFLKEIKTLEPDITISSSSRRFWLGGMHVFKMYG